ncbi:MAG: hypothetical protein HUJ98_01520 [Bacteroidaceae bacterium]|nr:hypothetical protein [Bacteroidaceae bacterium]
MPNWCFSSYVIKGEPKEISSLYNTMNELDDERKGSLVKNDFGETWLGNLVVALGEDWQKVYCRGSWSNLTLMSDTELSYDTETAWDRCKEVDDLLKKKFPSIQIFYIVEEPGMEIYYTNDTDCAYFTAVHVVESEDGIDEFVEYEDAKDRIEEIIGRELSADDDLDDALQDWAEANDTYASYHKFDIIEG